MKVNPETADTHLLPKPMLTARHDEQAGHYLVTLHQELEEQGPNGLSLLLADIIRHSGVAWGWDEQAIMDGVEAELDDPTDDPREVPIQ